MRRAWQTTPVFLPGESHGQRGIMGYSPWGHKESDMTEQLSLSLSYIYIYRFSSVAQLCLTLCNPMDCSTLGFPVNHQLPELAQTHVYWVSDAIQPSSAIPFPSCPQSSPAYRFFPMSRLFASGGQSIGASASASVLPMNIQDWSPLESTGLISLQSKGLSRVFSSTTVQKHQFFSAQLSL